MLKWIPRVFASTHLYPDGPKSGSVSKIRPTALSAAGIRPGSGGKAGAEEINWLLNSLTAHERATRYNWLERWTDLGVGFTSKFSGAARSKNGYHYLGGFSGAPYNRWSPFEGFTELGAPSAAIQWPALYATLSDHYNVRQFGIDASGNVGGWITSNDGVVVSDMTGGMINDGSYTAILAHWDEINASYGIIARLTGAINFGYQTTGSNAITDATTAPTVSIGDANNDWKMASGGGAMIAASLSVGTTSQFVAYSTDGGINWSAGGNISAGAVGDRLFGLGYIPDHPVHGSIFVAHWWDATASAYKLSYSTDNGANWSTLISSMSNEGLVSSTPNSGRSFFIGHTLICVPQYNTDLASLRWIAVYDITEERGFRIGTDPGAGKEIEAADFDGSRLWVRTSDDHLLVSDPIGIPPISIGSSARHEFD